MTLAIESLASGTLTPITSYNPANWNGGPLIQKQTLGGAEGTFMGPPPLALARPFESVAAIGMGLAHVIDWSSTIQWVFIHDQSTAAATRKVVMYTYNKTTGVYNFMGVITLTYPVATVHTIRAARMTYDTLATGTASASGTAVTGTSTTWSASRIGLGRIGFGSTDPTQITTWYQIASIASDTSLTLTTSAGTISNGAYVIEELRVVHANTNATATNGGLFVAKSIIPELFIGTVAGTTIPAATTVDNIRAVYWLADASTVTNTVAAGIFMEPRASFTSHFVWVVNGTTTLALYKYNLRAALTLTAGKDTTSLALTTAGQLVTGTATQVNNGVYAVAGHGPGSGLGCGYLTTSSRVYRTVALSTITNGANWQVDSMVEIPPGGTATNPATSTLTTISYDTVSDVFVVLTSGLTGFRHYVTKYNTVSSPMDIIFAVDTRQINQSTASSLITPTLTQAATSMSIHCNNGIYHFCVMGTTAATSFMYGIANCDWNYSSVHNNVLISPSLSTPNCDKFRRVLAAMVRLLGGSTGGLGTQTEVTRLSYRTSGISDNSGAWTAIDATGSLSGVTAANAIQFRWEFRTFGHLMVPQRVLGVVVTYDELTTLANYQPSVANSSLTVPRFAWRFSSAFGSTVPNLRVRLYDAVTGSTLLDDNVTASASGTFEKSTDGGSTWGSYNTTDKANETTYIRYTPTSFSSNVKVRSLLTLA